MLNEELPALSTLNSALYRVYRLDAEELLLAVMLMEDGTILSMTVPGCVSAEV